MTGEEGSPSRLEKAILAVPDGAFLRGIFFAVVGLTAWVLWQDVASIYRAQTDAARLSRTEPLTMPRPIPGDQVRPYLPRTIPVGPERGEPRLPGYEGPVDGESMGQPMRFLRAEGRPEIVAIGRIDPGTAARLETFLEAEGEGAEALYLHSPGGSVPDAIEMAGLVRAADLDTFVPDDGYCASACPLVFAGGVERLAGANAWVGVHQVYAVEIPGLTARRDLDQSISDIQATIADCQDLLVEMGVDPRVWIHAMRTPPDELYVFTADELAELKMTTPSGEEAARDEAA